MSDDQAQSVLEGRLFSLPRDQVLRLLRRPEVESKVGLKRSAIQKLIKKGEFPKPILLGTRTVAWDSRAIDDWILARINSPSKKLTGPRRLVAA